jgi:hypothetical protein
VHDHQTLVLQLVLKKAAADADEKWKMSLFVVYVVI